MRWWHKFILAHHQIRLSHAGEFFHQGTFDEVVCSCGKRWES